MVLGGRPPGRVGRRRISHISRRPVRSVGDDSDRTGRLVHKPGGKGGATWAIDYDPATRATALPNTWWTNGDTLTSNGKQSFTNETFPRASNYYVANQANLMVANLNSAFAKIASTGAGSGSSLAANST